MTRDERQALYDEARRYLADVQMSPDTTEADWWRAKDAVDRAEKAFRGTPQTAPVAASQPAPRANQPTTVHVPFRTQTVRNSHDL
jgi:hypothetical protein